MVHDPFHDRQISDYLSDKRENALHHFWHFWIFPYNWPFLAAKTTGMAWELILLICHLWDRDICVLTRLQVLWKIYLRQNRQPCWGKGRPLDFLRLEKHLHQPPVTVFLFLARGVCWSRCDREAIKLTESCFCSWKPIYLLSNASPAVMGCDLYTRQDVFTTSKDNK